MLKFNIPEAEKETYTTFPSFMLNRLERNKVEYKLYVGENILDELPHSYDFKGHQSRRSVACLATKLDSNALLETIEKMLDIDPKDI